MNNGPDVPPAEFTDRLQTLKQRGCNILVTGTVSEEVSQRMTRKLLGEPENPRARILALTDQDREDAPDLLPDSVAPSDESVSVVDVGGTRSATATSPPEAGAAWHRDGIDELRKRVCDAIATAKISQSGFEPAQLRVSVFTLSSLVNQYDPAAIEQFVSALGDHVRGARGMAHFHLPVADDAEAVRRLAPLFDVRIELRETNGLPEQRWHFPDRDVSTSWVGL
ncbi:DUF7504 family protein [Halorussus litoreus]|uniref:DUF7504 family protein n=1 Tax=Halorussus litoreus TaxID=1710536 RepID=UPI000E27A6BE|nr:hypothetical protein [Halorussus litoreus]